MPGSGIFATLGYAAESTWSTYAAPTSPHFVTFTKETLEFDKGIQQAHVLSGNLYDQTTRRAYVKEEAKGQIDFGGIYDRGLGLMFKNMLGGYTGSTSGSVTTQTFFPADTTGLSMSVQIGRPMTSNASVQAFTYEGCKVTDWELGVKAGEFATFMVTLDSYQEDTSQTYAAPSYVSSNMFTSIEGTLILGGTVSTSASVSSVSGGASVSLLKDVSVKPTNPLDTDRFYVGSAFKAEQLVNNFRQITGSATIAFNDLTTVYNAFKADTPVALQLNFTGPVISGSTHSALNLLIPNIYWDKDSISVQGPQLIDQVLAFTGLSDGTNNALQLQYVTLDAAP